MYAHKKPNIYETIKEHSLKTISYFDEEDNIYCKLLRETINVKDVYIKKLVKDMLYYHDFGKYCKKFQEDKLGISQEKSIEGNSNHSLKGAVYYYYLEKEYIDNLDITKKEKYDLYSISFILSYVISRHHSELGNINNYMGTLSNFCEIELQQLDELPSLNDKIIDVNHMNQLSVYINNKGYLSSIYMYFFIKYVRGLLSNCDYMATSTFMKGKTYNFNRMEKESIKKSIDNYMETEHFNSVNLPYNTLNSVQKLRIDYIKEMDKNMINIGEDNKTIDYLEAPTGVGKTHLSLRWALSHLEEGNKIIYCTQFNNVSEQSYEYYKNILDIGKEFRVSLNNSIERIYHLSEDSYEESYFRYQMLEYDFALTSNQRLINSLFGGSLQDARTFQKLSNSVIIIDELQNIPIKSWKILTTALNILVKYFNCHILLMSATLPKLGKLLNLPTNELIRETELINNKTLRNRVELDTSLYTHYSTMDNDSYVRLGNKMKENLGSRQVVEWITKKDANRFHNYMVNEDLKVPIYLLTGDTSSLERKEIIRKICEKETDKTYTNKDFILIATQVIEAGLDIDCEFGYKDVSTYDSEFQFMGRLNRNGYFVKGIFYPFNKTKEQWVNDDYRTLKIDNDYIKNLKNYNHKDYFDIIFDILTKEEDKALEYIQTGDYDELEKYVSLGTNTISLYIEDDEYGGISSIDYLNHYLNIMKGRGDFSEKKVNQSKYKKILSYFTKSIYDNSKNRKALGNLGITINEEGLTKITKEEFNILVS